MCGEVAACRGSFTASLLHNNAISSVTVAAGSGMNKSDTQQGGGHVSGGNRLQQLCRRRRLALLWVEIANKLHRRHGVARRVFDCTYVGKAGPTTLSLQSGGLAPLAVMIIIAGTAGC